MEKNQISQKCADNIRVLAASMVEKAKSGHPGGAMGGADFIHILFSEFLRYDPNNPKWRIRDRFFLDPGHMSPMLYATLSLCGKFSMEDLASFRQWGSITPGHPEVDPDRGIENTSGPLGQGHTMAVGSAIAERFLAARFGEWMSHKTYTFISDGGIQEEISQGAGRIAGYLGLSNLIMFFDSNGIQLSTTTHAVTEEDTSAKYKAWGWKVITIDGNDHQQIREALEQAHLEKESPTLIIGKTVMGKGSLKADGTNFENQVSTHGQPLSEAGADFDQTITHLGGDPSHPFRIFPSTEELYAQRKEELLKIVARQTEIESRWREEHPDKALLLDQYFAGYINGSFDFSQIEQKPNQATRAASSNVLAAFAKAGGIPNMIVSSADLANSDKTDGFLKQTKPFTRGDFEGAFFQAGVAELTMAAVMNGMALHGGVIPACGTFFVFSDYIKPAARMAALMELPVKYIWTHDAFRVGEDGPTHQPIEQEAQIRLMEKLQNHHGKNSILVLRPADSAETTVAWKLAMENQHSPTALILSRQNIKDLPSASSNRYQDALQTEKGAYTVIRTENPDVYLVASGSEVSTLVATAELLLQKGIRANVVSAPSEGLFRNQPCSYQEEVLPSSAAIFGLTAGLSVTLEGLVGRNGKVFGLNHFGYSAPYTVLDEQFGFTPQKVASEVLSYLDR